MARLRRRSRPLSCTVLTLGLDPHGHALVARALRILRGHAVVLTYGQLRAQPLVYPAGMTVFTCENPVVIRAAEVSLGVACPPLISTGGWPNAAVLTLLLQMHGSGAVIRHHGDEDPAGFGILAHLTDRVAARPWRLPAHEDECGQRHSGRPEELVIDALLSDLAAHAKG